MTTTVREAAAGISAARTRRLRRAHATLRRVVEVLILAGEFDIDLIPIENAMPEMAARINRGDVLYEQG